MLTIAVLSTTAGVLGPVLTLPAWWPVTALRSTFAELLAAAAVLGMSAALAGGVALLRVATAPPLGSGRDLGDALFIAAAALGAALFWRWLDRRCVAPAPVDGVASQPAPAS